jgi:hypothetical protein
MYLINYATRHANVTESEVTASSFLVSALEVDQWPASRPGRFNAKETTFILQEAGRHPESIFG